MYSPCVLVRRVYNTGLEQREIYRHSPNKAYTETVLCITECCCYGAGEIAFFRDKVFIVEYHLPTTLRKV